MKGTALFPQCGFSSRAVAILDRLGVPFETVDVLQDPEIRQGIKDYSDWPTVPQLYVKGEFVGGSDIMMEMFESGELAAIAGSRPPEKEEGTEQGDQRTRCTVPSFLAWNQVDALICSNRPCQLEKTAKFDEFWRQRSMNVAPMRKKFRQVCARPRWPAPAVLRPDPKLVGSRRRRSHLFAAQAPPHPRSDRPLATC